MPNPPEPRPAVAVVLAGGSSRRWGGIDKTARPLAELPLLSHAVAAVLPAVRALVVVAPVAHLARPSVEAAVARAGCALAWTREEPPGSGPVAGLAAGMAALPDTALPDAALPDAALRDAALRDAAGDRAVAVLAGDLPFTASAWPRLLAALRAHPEVDAVLGVDPDGRRQPLLGVYREGALRDRLASVPVVDQPLRVVIEGLRVRTVAVSRTEALDLDTAEDAAAAERIVARSRMLRGNYGAS